MQPEQLRPRLSRYDRPALTLAELMRGEGSDFIFQAVWTIQGRRVSREEHNALLDQLERQGSKSAVLAVLKTALEKQGKHVDLPGLNLMLAVEQRRNAPVIGPILVQATILADPYPAASLPLRFIRSIPGKFRWTYRHGRKLVIRLAGRSGLPSQIELRRTLGVGRAPARPDMTDRAVWLYKRLCETVDRPTEDN
jgi:hypothetical protein